MSKKAKIVISSIILLPLCLFAIVYFIEVIDANVNATKYQNVNLFREELLKIATDRNTILCKKQSDFIDKNIIQKKSDNANANVDNLLKNKKLFNETILACNLTSNNVQKIKIDNNYAVDSRNLFISYKKDLSDYYHFYAKSLDTLKSCKTVNQDCIIQYYKYSDQAGIRAYKVLLLKLKLEKPTLKNFINNRLMQSNVQKKIDLMEQLSKDEKVQRQCLRSSQQKNVIENKRKK